MRKLYEIDQDIDRLQQEMLENMQVDEETGEVIIDTSLLDELQTEREQKIEGVCLSYKNKKAELEMIKAEYKVFSEELKTYSDRAKHLERELEGLKGYIRYATNGEPFQTTRVDVRYRKNEVAELDEDFHDEQYGKTEYKPDRMAIKKALKEGTEIAGARLVTNITMSIK